MIEPQRELAEAIARLGIPDVEVLAASLAGQESFGRFDAVLSCPLGLPAWPVDRYGFVLAANLRPGGRFLIDLPSPSCSPDLEAACRAVFGNGESLEALRGPSGGDLAASLSGAGLRAVKEHLAAHLLDLESAHDLAALFAPALPAMASRLDEIGVALSSRLLTNGRIQARVIRTRVLGRL